MILKVYSAVLICHRLPTRPVWRLAGEKRDLRIHVLRHDRGDQYVL